MIPSRRSPAPRGERAKASDGEEESSDDEDTTDGPPSDERPPPQKKAKMGDGVLASKDSDETRREEIRLEKNRIKARNARRRKKIMIEDLEKRIKEVSDENQALKEENAGLRTRLIAAEGRNHSQQHETMQALPSVPYRFVGGVGEVPLPRQQLRAPVEIGATTSYGLDQLHGNEVEFDRYRTLSRSLPSGAVTLPPGIPGSLESAARLRERSYPFLGGQGIYRDDAETTPMLQDPLLAVRLRQAQAEDALRAVSTRYDHLSSQLSSSQLAGLAPLLPGQVALPRVSYSQDQSDRASSAPVLTSPDNDNGDVVGSPARRLRDTLGKDVDHASHRQN